MFACIINKNIHCLKYIRQLDLQPQTARAFWPDIRQKGEMYASYQCRSTRDIPASDITSLTGMTPKTWRIYTHSGWRDTRINLHSRNTDGVDAKYFTSGANRAILADPTGINAHVTDASSKGRGKSALGASLTAERGHSLRGRNYDPVRFALSAGRDCITMRGIPGIAFTCLELLREPQ